MNKAIDKIPAYIFGIIILCFFLPFINVSCSGQKVISITGLQMLTGTTVQQPELFNEKLKFSKVASEPLALIVLFIAVAGFWTLLVPKMNPKILHLLLSAGGIALLLVMKNKTYGDFIRQGGGGYSGLLIEYDVGFWLALTLFILIFIIALVAGSNKTPGKFFRSRFPDRQH